MCGKKCRSYSIWCDGLNSPCSVGNVTVGRDSATACATVNITTKYNSGSEESDRLVRLGDNIHRDEGEYSRNDNQTFCEYVMNAGLGYMKCDNDTLCIHPSLKCDGKANCQDESDEKDRVCPIVNRPENQTLPQKNTDFFPHNWDKKEATFACKNDDGTNICAIR